MPWARNQQGQVLWVHKSCDQRTSGCNHFLNQSIRQQIRTCLNELSLNVENSNIIPRLFEQFSRVKEASPEIEKIINLFVRREFKSKGEFLPYQRNLDKMTLKFILKNDLQNRVFSLSIWGTFWEDMRNNLQRLGQSRQGKANVEEHVGVVWWGSLRFRRWPRFKSGRSPPFKSGRAGVLTNTSSHLW